MKKVLFTLLILIFLYPACTSRKIPKTIPQGTWKYRLYINGTETGNAVISNTLKNNRYISTLEMEMSAGSVTNYTRQIITETVDYKPITFEVYNRVVTNKNTRKMDTIARFTGNNVSLAMDKTKTKITLPETVVLDGNFFIGKLIKKGFKKGTLVKQKIYDPTMEIEEPISVSVRVKGWEKVVINNKQRQLIHIEESIEDMKSLDAYINSDGVVEKAIISMLNNRFELIIQK